MSTKTVQKSEGLHYPLIFSGIAALLAGTLVYLVDRPPEDTFFVHKFLPRLSLHNTLPPFFGKLGAVLPAFVHPFSLSLITAGVIARTPAGCLAICVFWFAVNSAFELGQLFKSAAVFLVPGWLEHIPVLENCKSFFQNGTFDPLDLAAMFAGASLAFCLTTLFMRKKR
ncbi:MAG: hypothetical protein K9K62_09375 [Desulfobacteraceae bacterium]|nr:hypothetical protein [Desulfobacteraceae bacterium]